MTDNAINYGALSEAINDKMDRDGLNADIKPAAGYGVDYVVEWKVPTESDPSWYRKYASGWVEQGGQFTKTANPTYCTLPITMANTSYYINTSFNSNNSASKYEKTAYFLKETTRFGMNMGSYNAQETNTNNTICNWEVKGMAA